jgi:hypothetical protein
MMHGGIKESKEFEVITGCCSVVFFFEKNEPK